MTPASAATRVTLTLRDSGSTGGGAVTANRGNIACSIRPGKSGAALAGRCAGEVGARGMVFLTATPGIGAMLHQVGITREGVKALPARVEARYRP